MPKLSEAQWQALEKVVEYLAHDEHHHWVECDQPDDHIWLSVRKLADMLKAAGRIPNVANFYGFTSDGDGDD
jgi:ABC-type Zn uptake system ZnuABC Zn-binding protein ZnuA